MKKNTYIHEVVIVAIGVLTAIFSMSVFAQSTVLEEITVTAQKTETNLQSTPISMVVMSGDNLEDLGIDRSGELDNFIPNLNIDAATLTGGTSTTYSIRGIGTFGTSPVIQNTVAVYVDDMVVAGFEAGMLNLLDLERVEVLRGPQGTLFGRNAIAGAIHYISKRPDTDSVFGNAKVTAGENGRLNIGAAINIPFSDRFAGRFAISDTSVDGYIHSDFFGDDLGAQDSTGIRAAFLFEATDDLSFDLILDYSDSEQVGNIVVHQTDQNFEGQTLTGNWLGGGPFGGYRPWTTSGAGSVDMDPNSTTFGTITGLTEGQCGPLGLTAPCTLNLDPTDLSAESYSSLGTNPDGSELTNIGASFKINWDLSDSLTLRSISGYRDSDSFQSIDFDGTPFHIRHGTRDITVESLSQEFQILWQSDRASFVGGLYYYDDEQKRDDGQSYFGQAWYDDDCTLTFVGGAYGFDGCTVDEYSASGDSRTVFQTVGNTSTAIYANLTVPINDVFEVIVGGRYTEDEQDLHIVSEVNGFTTDGLEGTEFSEGVFTPRLVLNSQWTDELFTYLSYSQGYRQGGINSAQDVDSLGAPIDALVPAFGSETNDAYEVGLKVDFWGGRARLNSAYYFYQYNDLQTTATDPGGESGPFQQNAADVEIQGFESNLTVALSDSLTFSAAIGTNDAEYTSIGGATQIALESGLPRAPELSYALGLAYQKDTSLGLLAASVNYGFTGEQFDTPQDFNNLPTLPNGSGGLEVLCTESVPSQNRTDGCNGNQGVMPEYALVSARAQISSDDESWTVGIYCQNCTDEYYLFGQAMQGQSEPTASPFFFNIFTPGRPREFGVDFSYNF